MGIALALHICIRKRYEDITVELNFKENLWAYVRLSWK